MNLPKLTTAFLGKGTLFNYQLRITISAKLCSQYLSLKVTQIRENLPTAKRQKELKSAKLSYHTVCMSVFKHNHFLFDKAYLVVLPQMNLACCQRPLHPLLSLDILQGAIKYFPLK